MTCHPSIHRSTWIVDITLNLPTSKGLIILSGGDLRQRYFFKWFESKRLQPKGGVKIIRLVPMTCLCAGDDDNSNVAFVDWLNNSQSRVAETIAKQKVTRHLTSEGSSN